MRAITSPRLRDSERPALPFNRSPRLACLLQKSDGSAAESKRSDSVAPPKRGMSVRPFWEDDLVQKPSSSSKMRLISFAVETRAFACACACGALLAASTLGAAARPDERAGAAVNVEGAYLAGLVAGEDQDTNSASTYFSRALKGDPKNPELMERTFIAELSNGDLAKAFDLARSLVARDQNNGLAQLALGVKDLSAGKFASARDHFTKGGARSDITSTLLEAWSSAGAGDLKRALTEVSSLSQPRFQIFKDYHQGLIEDFSGRSADAKVHLQAAYAGDPQTFRIVDAWGRFNDRTGDVDAAKKAYAAYLDLMPREPLAAAALQALNSGKKLDASIRSAQVGAAEVLFGVGAAGIEGTDVLPAMIYIRLALFLSPHDDLAAMTLGDLYEREKQHEAAIDLYGTIPASSPLSLETTVQTALVHDEIGQHDQALKSLQSLVAKHPDNVDALTALGNVQRGQKDYAGAEATYTAALDKSGGPSAKTNWTLLYFRGICEERQNKWTAAEADFKQALVLFPDQPLVLNYLGYSWVDRGINLDEAFAMLQKAAQLRPDDGFIVDSLGWAFFKLGNYSQAEKALERAVLLEPSDATVNEHLGDVYWKNGRKLEAHFQWNHARDFGPDKEDLPRILDKIAHGLPDPAPQAPAAAAPAPAEPTDKKGG